MAFINDYKPENYNVVFDVADGDHVVIITGAREVQTSTGKRMLEVAMKVQGVQGTYIERYVEGEYFNSNITRFFDYFQIERGNFNFNSWINKNCGGHFEHRQREYNGNTRTECYIKYLIAPGTPLNMGTSKPLPNVPTNNPVQGNDFPEDAIF